MQMATMRTGWGIILFQIVLCENVEFLLWSSDVSLMNGWISDALQSLSTV